MRCNDRLPRVKRSSLAPAWAMGGRGPTFAQDSGDIRDAAGRSPAYTRSGGAVWGIGPDGLCLDFTGGGAASGSLPFATTTVNYSVIMKVFLTSNMMSGVFIKLGGTEAEAGFGLGVGNGTLDSSGNNLVGLVEGGAWLSTGTVIGTGWHSVGVSSLGGTYFSFFLDGSLVYTTTGPWAAFGAGVCLGCDGPSVRPFAGKIGPSEVFGRTLAPVEFAARAANPGLDFVVPRRTRRRYCAIVSAPAFSSWLISKSPVLGSGAF